MFKVGDVVELKSGSVPMTVSNVKDKDISVVWYCDVYYQFKQSGAKKSEVLDFMDSEMFKLVEPTT